MKKFNLKREKRKLWLKQHKWQIIKDVSLILCTAILMIAIMYYTKADFSTRVTFDVIDAKVAPFSSGDVVFAYNVDGVSTKTLDSANNDYYYLSNECSNGVTYIVTNNDWQNGTINNLGDNGTKCTIYLTALLNSVSEWLKIIDSNKTYTTLSEVLNDTDTLEALINNNSDCDYLSNSTYWISDITNNSNAMEYIGNNEYCGNILFYNEDWENAISNSTYLEKILKSIVPVMTSNTTPYGEAFAYTIASNTEPYYEFDGSLDASVIGMLYLIQQITM